MSPPTGVLKSEPPVPHGVALFGNGIVAEARREMSLRWPSPVRLVSLRKGKIRAQRQTQSVLSRGRLLAYIPCALRQEKHPPFAFVKIFKTI